MRACIDGSSGKRLFMSGGLTNLHPNTYQQFQMSPKSNSSSQIRKILDVYFHCFTLYLLFIAHLNSSYPVGHWTWQQNNQKKKKPACLVAMDKDAAFAHRLSHVYEVCTMPLNDNPIALQLPHHREMPPCLICAYVTARLSFFSLVLWTTHVISLLSFNDAHSAEFSLKGVYGLFGWDARLLRQTHWGCQL